MSAPVDEDRRFWRTVLAEGGVTALPRWSVTGERGLAEHEVVVPPGVTAGLDRLAGEAGVGPGAVLLAAHAKVLAAFSGESDIITGYRTAAGEVLPCRVPTGARTWRGLLVAAARAEAGLLAHADFEVERLRRELDVPGPEFEAVLDPVGSARPGDLGEGTVLRVGVERAERAGMVLRLWYRTEALDEVAASRIAGYYRRALELIQRDPDDPHAERILLSAEEMWLHLQGLAGPCRPVPDLRFHQLFEETVREHPGAVAARHGESAWTYRELNARANQLARAIRARGVPREGVVAVVTERNLDWLAAVLAIFKAGAVYLPVEPRLPAERISAMLSRAASGLVLTESGGTETLDAALATLPGVSRLLIQNAYAEGHRDSDLDVPVAADQLAYIYFTSGSTGEPKGAMCEHAGMLNHLYAKIDDLGIREGQVVAQTAPQSFDISLWQLVSALLVGGSTLIVEQEVILDVPRLLDRLVDARVGVLQVVPSYLDAVVSSLEQHPRALPDLAIVSVTGEALKPELARRWFAVRPGTPLVNAYGLTETSDDTNHEILTEPPERVLLGRCVNNVRVYVVDENLAPVPLGAPGLIAFSGVCVGRGYVNDPERTRAAYRFDPYREGERLYLGGDYGRWHPGGKLEFLGRRDNQVKIRGFRIEIGEIENALLTVPGVRDAAVVTTSTGANAQLVAFYASAAPLPGSRLREDLAAGLPEYMIPAAFHWRSTLPTTSNSKVDRKALARLAAEPEGARPERNGHDETASHHIGPGGPDAPATPTERRVAAAWAGVLGVAVEEIGRHDDFFDRGGTSLSAVKLAIALDRAVSLAELTRHPVLADLAALIDGPGQPRDGLLRPLAGPDTEPVASLICFPYAGGTAVNFQPMAERLRGTGIAVYAVELPGHDPASSGESLATLDEVAGRVVDEIVARDLSRVLVWGHSSGTAYAVETARRLQETGKPVQHVFLGAQLLGEAAERRAAIEEIARRDPAELVAEFSTALPDGRAALEVLDAQRIGATYRHDCLAAHRYFAGILASPPEVKLSAPVTVVVAADDPVTARFRTRLHDWRLLAERVESYELPGGGHYFPRTRPAEAAGAVLGSLASPIPAFQPVE